MGRIAKELDLVQSQNQQLINSIRIIGEIDSQT